MNSLLTAYQDTQGIVRKAWYTGRQARTVFLRPDSQRLLADTVPVVDYDLAVGDILQYDPYSVVPGTAQDGAALATTQAGLNATRGIGACVGAPNIGTAYRAASAGAAVTAVGANCVPTPADIGVNAVAYQARLMVVVGLHPDCNRRSDPLNANANLARQRDGGWVDVCPLGVVDALFFKNTDILVPAGCPLGLYQPATSAAVGGVILYGSGTANTGKPAFTNLLDADLDRTVTTATTTLRDVLDCLHRIQAFLEESVDTAANGGGAASTTSLRRVAIGGSLPYGI